jgi:predicted permease
VSDDSSSEPTRATDRGPLWRVSVVEEVDDELAFHVEMRVRQLVAGGMSPEAARAEAIRRFGDFDRVTRACREIGRRRDSHMRMTELLGDLRQDIEYAVRQLRRSAGFAAVAVLTLALGIGATTAIFSVVHAVVLRAVPYVDPDRVMLISETFLGRQSSLSAGNFAEYRARSSAFAAMSAVQYANFNLVADDRAERVFGGYVSHGFFDVFPVRPILGRVFTADEDAPGRESIVILSHRLWSTRFAADSGLPGREIRLNGRPHLVVGVMPSDFDLTSNNAALWVPIAFTPQRLAMYDERYLTVFGLLEPTVSRERAQRELEPIARDLARRFPDVNGERGVLVQPFAELMIGDYGTRLLVLLGAVGLVLLIACTNVANLLLARGAARARELAIRTALGAGRGRIARQLLTESLLLAGIATALGLVVAHWSIPLFVATAPPGVPRLAQAGLNGAVLAFAVLAAAVSTLIFGLAPALRAARSDPHDMLRKRGRSSPLSIRDPGRAGLVITQVGLALTLLIGAGLLVRSAMHLHRVDLGFEPAGVLSARITLPRARYETPDATRSAFVRIVAALAALPGVESAAATSQAPMAPGGNSNGLLPEGRPDRPENAIDSRLRIVTPGYFGAMRIDLREGRELTDQDVRSAQLVMVVSETLARLAFPGESPVGRRIACCEREGNVPNWKVVVGVVADTRGRGPAFEPEPEFYLPIAQVPPQAWDWTQRSMTLVARAAGDPTLLSGAMRDVTRAVDSTLPVYDIATMTERFGRSIAAARFTTLLLATLGAIGLVLACVGLYGVLAYVVAQRTHEIGVRMALGATARDVTLLVTQQGLRLMAIGVIVGIAGALFATRVLAGMLEGVTPTDPVTFVVVTAVLLVAGVIASLIPAQRAARVDPVVALREE